MNDDQLLRYSRHILVDELGIEAQQCFLDAHALIIGAGGLGSPAAMYLAAAGVGSLTLVDADTVDLTNLQRQILHVTASVGHKKVDSGRAMLAALNPEVQVHAVAERVDGTWLANAVPQATVVLDCSDNFATRHAINRVCFSHRVPLISGAALRFDGQISTFDFRDAASPCYACIFPEDQPFEEVACSTMGVFAPTVGIIGAMQAAEALRVIAGIGTPLVGRLMMLNSLQMEWTTMRIARQPGCPVCGHPRPSPTDALPPEHET
ncbi:molybdopterin-synthase adenylyltransferase MoeB [Paraburkholderia bonniea]|uniref:HesA/MoeB/ThiF family protein n=1 Tax=Paraburkholderia bonniea TaxID=2152891 RepID=UPI00129112A1|nr:molybdopterin-synthase adenylyltransferase MoeB [Paraburkholderia bonniea]WJF89997.1 molybdopterin-synthase adenylyltransferase MoeB [Paraburkholderia bonniea]WJF93311.1 molybdopterin-synthase adenylyltransferase MoeB [Paraburkholderia bonniea]